MYLVDQIIIKILYYTILRINRLYLNFKYLFFNKMYDYLNIANNIGWELLV